MPLPAQHGGDSACCLPKGGSDDAISTYLFDTRLVSLETYLYYALDAKHCQPQDCLGSGNHEAAGNTVACC